MKNCHKKENTGAWRNVAWQSRLFLRQAALLFILLTLSGLFAQTATGEKKSQIIGIVVDEETGDPVIGANIYLENTTIGAASDLDGSFIIPNVPEGQYTLMVQMIGYATLKITDYKVSSGQNNKLSLTLKPESLTTNEVVVEARMLKNNEASLLRERQMSDAVSDAISAEAISRSGSGDAAEAMSRVTGASVVGGKYVFIRGLGERYSSTMLNGAELPSADPDKKSFQMDLLPSNLLDNIVAKKTFTPDEPGNFSGGIVDIGTKAYPESFTLKFSTSGSYNSESSLNSKFLTYPGGSKDWLGMGNGSREVPSILSDPAVKIPSPNAARRDREQALLLDEMSKAFDQNMVPTQKSSPVNQSYSLSVGNQTRLFGRTLGYLGSVTYSHKYSMYENGTIGQWQLSGNADAVDGLKSDMLLNDSKGSEEVLWGGMATISYKPHPAHELSLNYLHTQSGESVARTQSGQWPFQLAEGPVYETRALLYTERNLNTYQARGQHFLKGLVNSSVEWTSSYSTTRQNEPDLRFFSNDYRIIESGGAIDTAYAINTNSYNYPTRFFRDLTEDNFNSNLSVSVPFRQWSGLTAKIKFGGAYNRTTRDFTERRFEMRQQLADYDGNPEDFFSLTNTGIVDSSRGRYYFGNYITDQSQLRNNYGGNQKIAAGFAMTELPIFRELRFIGGARFETTRLNVASRDTTAPEGHLKTNDWLPSAGLVYQVGENMNLRAAYGKTLARPTFREMAPYRTFEFLGDYLYEGNADLQRTLIDNYDLRWEWFMRPGEIVAVSVFYKRFKNPIERTVDPASNQISYQNVDRGTLYGAEFEVRKQLDQISRVLGNFQVGVNYSLVHSVVDISPEENELIHRFDPSAANSRPLFGQSPYIVNVELGYQNLKSGTAAGVFYNVFGKRLSEVSLGATPDVYEQPRPALDFTFSQKLGYGMQLKMGAKNILNSSFKRSQEFKGKEYIYQEYNPGRSYSLGLSYNL